VKLDHTALVGDVTCSFSIAFDMRWSSLGRECRASEGIGVSTSEHVD
jgi:hypothetical protein